MRKVVEAYVFEGEKFTWEYEDRMYYTENSKGTGTVNYFDDDGDWGFWVRVDTDRSPKEGIRKTFRGKNCKEKAMKFVEKELSKK